LATRRSAGRLRTRAARAVYRGRPRLGGTGRWPAAGQRVLGAGQPAGTESADTARLAAGLLPGRRQRRRAGPAVALAERKARPRCPRRAAGAGPADSAGAAPPRALAAGARRTRTLAAGHGRRPADPAGAARHAALRLR